MATEQGIVTEIGPGGMAKVVTTRSGACESCSSRGMCHSVGGGGNDAEVMVINAANARVGDRIVISFDSGSLLKAMFLIYIFPIVCLLLGALIGQRYAPELQMNPSALSAVVGFSFFGLAVLFIRYKGNRMAKKDRYRPRITRVLERGLKTAERCGG